ncbi:YSIRK-type signal peptide-containing protein [Staphylococcus pseudintermedius]|uniref:SdrD B-like domain-containing protein n=10 Tax=Staphylococcus pseudintermedius TaxID=283734 RepID=UPI0018E14A37|nr:SdrD B-like domain-containing protein [Staphylococcus pseudintermedius]EHA6105658.1 YSIRK-type signal peptide-containing protein [Staphylococcus pseudintermedius]EHT3642951.1 carboxypeptidase regulatory-like domain-containing protein [Staphylococcus pseudintermedius]EIQ3887072.1 carboxypeptidase regulatory-like domain-containing protein [Staphylococcus pseudintermedius]EJG0090887.1 carboxypeptidase regulatory-like domain-containing protein [Staphylococcus pseudintermedius]EJM2416839.1 carbo
MITNKNIYSIRKHKLGVASFLLGTLFVVGHANNAEASEVSATTQEHNVETEQTKTEGELTTEVAQQAVSESAPIAENMQKTTSVASENAKEVTASDSTQEVTKTEAKDTATMKDSEIAQPVSEVNKPVTQTAAPVAEPSTANKQTSPRQVQELTAPMDTKVINVENGTDVTSKVKVEKSSITGHQNKDKTYHQSNTVNPHKAERVTLNYDWSFENGIKAGDYFDFQLSDNVDTNGISTIKKVPHIMDSQNSEQIIAYGEINENNRVRYRFMDYVNQKENLKGKLSLNLFIKPDKVQDEGKITVTSQLGKEMTSQEFDIKYIDGVKSPSGITLNGRLDELSKADQSFTHYAIFKPKHNNLTNVTLRGTVSNNAQQNEKNGQVNVYEYIGQGELPQSAYANVKDTNQFRDITNSLRPTTVNSTGYQITFDHINKKPYVIVYKGHYKNEAKDLEFTTNATDYHSSNLYSYNYWPYYGSFNLTWKNGVAFYSNKANGEGNDKPVPPTYGFSELVDTTQNTAPATMTFQTTGVLEEIEDSVVLNTLSQSGEDRGENTSPIIETTEDSQPVEFEEETNHGIQDVTLHADAVDFEEETNHGEQDTVHHSDVVEYDEDTTTGMLTGAISDHTTEEDTMEYTTDGLLIEFDDEMNPNVSGQYDDITTDTIEESSHIDTFTELESEFGQHDGIVTFEEDTIVEKPKTEKGNRVPLVIDLSTPKHNHQFNIQPTDPNIDTSATYRIGNFVWRDEDHNGVQNDGEHGLEGVLVTLKTADGVVLNTTTSDANGHYQFTNVQKGKYIVEFTTPEGYEATSKHTTANTEKDSDGLIANIDVTQDDMSIDAGFFPLENWNAQPKDETYTIGDFVWRDEDHNGVQNDGEHGLEGVLVTLKTADGVVLNTTTSDANGHYQFTNVQKGKYIVEFTTPEGYEATSKHTTANTEKDSDGLIANIDVTQDDMSIDAGFFPLENWNPQPKDETYTIGDFVWRDEDHNGVQNDGEHGLEGVLVTLKTADGVVLNTTTSDANGHYQFTNVQKGKYIVEFTTPEGYEATSKHTTANTEKDSDGLIANIDVTQDDMSIDAGFFPLENWNPQPKDETYTIGDFVWRDEDHNGVQNDGEHGLEGVLVTLKTADGVVLNTTTSDANGHYQFTNVQKGKYIVEFTTPEGYEATSKHTTANTEKDSDGLIANIDVTQDDMSIDAGFFPLENWNPQPEPKNPDDKEKPGPEQPDVPQPEPKNPDDREKPAPEQPDVPQPEPKNPDDREKPAPEQPDVPQPEPKNPDDKEKPAPEQPDVPQPKPMLPGEKVKPKPTHPGEAMQTTPQDKSTSQTDEALPKTGESSSQSSALIFGGLLSLLGLGLLRRSSKQNRSSMK